VCVVCVCVCMCVVCVCGLCVCVCGVWACVWCVCMWCVFVCVCVCVCVCNLIYAACKALALYYIVISGLSGCTVFFHIISQTVRFEGEKLFIIQNVCFDFVCNICMKTFLNLRRIQRDVIINVCMSSRKVPVILVKF